jgi:hypothetical protein
LAHAREFNPGKASSATNDQVTSESVLRGRLITLNHHSARKQGRLGLKLGSGIMVKCEGQSQANNAAAIG